MDTFPSLKGLLTLVTLIFIYSHSFSQDLSKDISVPPAPDAAALGQYGEIPVDKFHGIPQIDIPLYNIQVDDITVPISLSFHASGYKVGTTASWVGLGWSLNAGGTISRTMKGRPDESGYFLNMNKILEWEQEGILDYIFYPGYTELPQWYIDFTENISKRCNTYKLWFGEDYSDCPDDSEVIQILGIYQEKLEYLNYVPVANLGDIEDVKNTMYDFYSHNWDVQPDLFFYNFPGGSGKFMFKPDMSITQFPYQDIKIIPSNLSYSENSLDLDYSGFIDAWHVYDENGIFYNFSESEKTIVDLGNSEDLTYDGSWHLKRILSQRSNKEVNFTYSPLVSFNGTTINGNSITETFSFSEEEGLNNHTMSFNTNQTVPNYEVKYIERIDWDDGYILFNPGSSRQDIPGARQLGSIEIFNYQDLLIKKFDFNYSYVDGYMRLESITEIGQNGLSKPPHTFEYHNGIPSLNSFAQDHYGFFNGATNNTTLVPSFYNAKFGTLEEYANRESGNATSVVGMLKKINYPTGGHSNFIYEANDYSTTDVMEDWVIATAEKCDANGFLIDPPGGPGIEGLHCIESQFSDPITLSYSHTISSTIKVEILYDYQNQAIEYQGPDFAGVKIYEVVGGNNVYVETYHGMSNQEIDDILEPGKTYVIEASTNLEGVGVKGTISNKYNQLSNVHTGGIRIREIVHSNGLDYREIKYKYDLAENPGESSGQLNQTATPFNYSMRYYKSGDLIAGTNEFIVHYASPKGMLGSFSSDHIAYKQVYEYEEGKGGVRSYYSTQPDLLPFPQELPVTNRLTAEKGTISNFWKRGSLEKEEIYAKGGALIQTTTNHYSFLERDTTRTFIYEIHDDWNGFNNIATEFKYDFSWHISGWARLDSTVTTYQDGLQTSVTNTYLENSDLILPIKTDYSLGNDLDYSDSIVYYNDRTNHIVNPLLTRKRFDDEGNLLEWSSNTYSGHKLTRSTITDGSGEIMGTTDYSNHNGLKPSYFQPHTGVHTVIIWGYNNTLPVAQVVNATHAEVQAALPTGYDPGGDGLSGTDETSLRSNLPSDAILTVYHHKPLVGLVEQVDPNGLKTTYEYDDLGRLLWIKDNENNILKKFEYNYNGQ